MMRKGEIDSLRKKRDISRAYEDKEGSVATLAKRFHASTRTVQEAIKHDAGWWQERVAEAGKGRAGPGRGAAGARPHQYRVFGLAHLRGKDGRPGYQVAGQAGGPFLMVEGTIDDVLAALAADGWEVLQLVPRGGGEWSDVLVRRLAS
ncbi:MAG: hypothetical protein JW839_17250 [Candidatus Lokiarchaeota archaeon]|nr:hypothetical protein [Candidatus Lokiarchaeota archaeon]